MDRFRWVRSNWAVGSQRALPGRCCVHFILRILHVLWAVPVGFALCVIGAMAIANASLSRASVSLKVVIKFV